MLEQRRYSVWNFTIAREATVLGRRNDEEGFLISNEIIPTRRNIDFHYRDSSSSAYVLENVSTGTHINETRRINLVPLTEEACCFW